MRRCLKTGDWPTCTIQSYVHVNDELCTTALLALRGTSLIMPKLLRFWILNIAHKGHQGIVKTKLSQGLVVKDEYRS